MLQRNSRHYADRIVFWLVVLMCAALFGFLWGEYKYQQGFNAGQEHCPKVPGERVTSTYGNICIYHPVYGVVGKKRRAS